MATTPRRFVSASCTAVESRNETESPGHCGPVVEALEPGWNRSRSAPHAQADSRFAPRLGAPDHRVHRHNKPTTFPLRLRWLGPTTAWPPGVRLRSRDQRSPLVDVERELRYAYSSGVSFLETESVTSEFT